MTWQVIRMNGQQRPIAAPTTLAWNEEAITAAAAFTRAIVTPTVRLAATTAMHSDHFYICSTER